jgi:hypothetical protein
LQDEFRDRGLQTVVRIHSIELDPETPSFPGEEWHTLFFWFIHPFVGCQPRICFKESGQFIIRTANIIEVLHACIAG